VGALAVVVVEPGVEVCLEGIDAFVEGLAERDPEELVERGLVELLHKTVGLWSVDLGPAMLDAVEVEIELIGVILATNEFPAVVGEGRLHRQSDLKVERQHVIVQQ